MLYVSLCVKARTLLENFVHCIVNFESLLPLKMQPDFIPEPGDKQILIVISGSVTGAFACVELVPLTLHQQSSKIAG